MKKIENNSRRPFYVNTFKELMLSNKEMKKLTGGGSITISCSGRDNLRASDVSHLCSGDELVLTCKSTLWAASANYYKSDN